MQKSTKSKSISLEVIRNQESVFAIFMGVIAFLIRENPDLQYPVVCYSFVTFFIFNLAYHSILRRYSKDWVVPFISIAVNCLIITFILSTSGGEESYFWPMYLLPIFTACMYLEERHVALAVMMPAAFLGYFYLEYVYNYEGWKLAELLIKWAVLGLAAGVTMRESFKQRQAVNALRQSQLELDQITQSQEIGLKTAPQEKKISPDQALHHLMQDMYLSLSMIWASTQILLQDADSEKTSFNDLSRIQIATRNCYQLLVQSKKWIHVDEKSDEKINVGQVVTQCVNMFGYQMNRKQLKLIKDVDPDLPEIKLSHESVFQPLLGVFVAMMEVADFNSTLTLNVHEKEGGIFIEFICDKPMPESPFKDLEYLEQLFSVSGGKMSVENLNTAVKCEIFLPSKAPAAPIKKSKSQR